MERELGIRDFVWEIIRRNQIFRHEFKELKSNSNGEKIGDPGFCYKWSINRLYNPSACIERFKSQNECDDNYLNNHPIMFSMIKERSEEWYKKYLFDLTKNKVVRLCNPYESFYDLDQDGWPYLDYEIEPEEDDEDEWTNAESSEVVGHQLSLLDIEGVRPTVTVMKNEADEESSVEDIFYDEQQLFIVNRKSIRKYYEYLKVYDTVEAVVREKSGYEYKNGAICLPSGFDFLKLYAETEFQEEKEKRINKFDRAVFKNEKELLKLLKKYETLKIDDKDISEKVLERYRIESDLRDRLVDNIATQKAGEALEKRKKRAFNKIADFILHTPHNVVFTSAKFRPIQ